MGWIEYLGEQVYHPLVQNAFAPRMLFNQLTPHLPKGNEEVNVDMEHLQAMLDAATVVDPTLNCDDDAQGHELDHRQAIELHWRNAAEDETGMIEICVMSSAVEMHATRSKTGIRSVSALNRSSVKKGIRTTMIVIMTNLTDSILPKGGTM
jgi:hypothetical protein